MSDVQAGSPAAKAGVEPGDVIVRFAGKTVSSPTELQMLVERSKSDVEKTLDVIRDGEKMSLNVTCSHRVEEAVAENSEVSTKKGKLGLELSNLTADVAERLGVKGTNGVVITSVQPGSLAAKAGLRVGDVLLQINRKLVKSVADVESALKDQDPDGSTLLLVKNERGSRFVVIQPTS